MISKNDCLSMLVNLEDSGIDVDMYMHKLFTAEEVPLEVLQFIAKNKGIEVVNFYEMLRKKHNKHKSPLYTNLLKEIVNIDSVVVTLSCLLTQISLYGKNLTDSSAFYKEVRAEEITRVLNEYFDNGSGENCVKLLKLIKSDIIVLDYVNGRRSLATDLN